MYPKILLTDLVAMMTKGIATCEVQVYTYETVCGFGAIVKSLCGLHIAIWWMGVESELFPI